MAPLWNAFSCFVLLAAALKTTLGTKCIHPTDCKGKICDGCCKDKLGVSTPVCIFVPTAGNLAALQPTSASTTRANDPAVLVDGDRSTSWGSQSCWAAETGDMNPWWQVELPHYYFVSQVQITNRGDCGVTCDKRLHDFEIELFDRRPVPGMKGELCLKYVGVFPNGATLMLPCAERAAGRFLRINAPNRVNADDLFTMCEVEVYGGKILSEETCCGSWRQVSELYLMALLLLCSMIF